MFVLIGMVALAASVLIGYIMHGGKIPALMQVSEFVIIGGAGFSSLLAASSPKRVADIFKDTIALLKADPYGKAAYLDLLQLLYDISSLSRREGLLSLEKHIENPEESEMLQRFPTFNSNHHAVSFMCDSLRLLLLGGVGTFELQEMMEGDIEGYSEEVVKNSSFVGRIADAMPAFGIVAAVLGVVITMQYIDGPPEEIGEKVAAALVGTFLGVLLGYGVFAPLSTAMETRAEAGVKYMTCLKNGILSLAQGVSPMLVVEFARRSIESEVRPGFQEVEDFIKGRGMVNSEKEAA